MIDDLIQHVWRCLLATAPFCHIFKYYLLLCLQIIRNLKRNSQLLSNGTCDSPYLKRIQWLNSAKKLSVWHFIFEINRHIGHKIQKKNKSPETIYNQSSIDIKQKICDLIRKMPVEFNQLNLKRNVGSIALTMLVIQFEQKKNWISGEISYRE